MIETPNHHFTRAGRASIALALCTPLVAAQPTGEPQPARPTTQTTDQPGQDTPGLTEQERRRNRNRDNVNRPVPFERPPESEAATPPKFPIVLFDATATGLIRTNSTLDDRDNGYAVASSRAAFDTIVVVAPFLTINTGFSAEFASYDFEGGEPLIPGDPTSTDPFGSAQTYQVSLTTILRQSRQLTYLVGGSVNASYEPNADFSDAIAGSVLAGVTYAPTENLTIGAGFNINFDLDDSIDFFPLPFIEWRFAERWELASGRRGIELTYEHSDTLTYGVGTRFIGREFRLDDQGTLPGGIVQDDSVAIAGVLEWNPAEEITVEFVAGAQVFNRLELRNNNNVRVFESNGDPAFVAALRLTMNF